MKEKSSKFKIEGTTADKRLIAFGSTYEELFQNAAIGMLSEIASLEDVRETECKELKVESGEGFEGLLVGLLNDLLYYFDVENFVGKRVEVKFVDEDGLTALVFGSKVGKEVVTGEIKAATHHELSIRKKEGVFEARVILDV